MKTLAYFIFVIGAIQAAIFGGMFFKRGLSETQMYAGGVYLMALAAFIMACQKK